MDEWAYWDATEQAEHIHSGDITPLEMVDSAIARIDQMNPLLNAVTTRLYEQARQQAISHTLPTGPFRGVPLLLKDFYCQTYGDPYYEGVKFLRERDWRAEQDTYLAMKFRAAGFIVLGKANLTEMAGSTESIFGRTNNPWDTSRSPGMSSSGSAAAVAAGMVSVAHANDGYGSIRIPASACGLVGLKPSRGRVSSGPARVPGILGNIVEHVLTRTVRDTAALLDAIHGPMPGDLFYAPPPERAYSEEVGRDPGRLRIGLLTDDLVLNLPVHKDCINAVQQTGKLLETLGHIVEEAYPPALTGSTGLGEALRIVASSGTAARLDYWSERLGRRITPDDISPALWARAELGRSYSAVQIHLAIARLAGGVMRLPEWWSGGFDLLITPTMQQPAPKWEGLTPENEAVAWGLFTMPYSVSGQPALSLPLSWTENGLPVGVQFIADYGREDILIRIATQLEQANPWSSRHPLL